MHREIWSRWSVVVALILFVMHSLPVRAQGRQEPGKSMIIFNSLSFAKTRADHYQRILRSYSLPVSRLRLATRGAPTERRVLGRLQLARAGQVL